MIETIRLIIRPLTNNQLIKYMTNDGSLETDLNLNSTSMTISDDLREALEHPILPNVEAQRKNYVYSTLWSVISKEENKMVGDLCFMGEPNTEGDIEIGYGTYEDFRKRGFMTEAVGGMIQWAEMQPDVKSIIASTNKDNLASSTVLQNNDFLLVGETDTWFTWKLEINRQ